ncbi:MAG: hypothetical protein A2W35_08785 [Chloroflexi bacterium RBG_16_57_11]|nr:MAG: hypothetical protein A2W35_08785 [Chloroflexi bacterium RBG_16_57_11]
MQRSRLVHFLFSPKGLALFGVLLLLFLVLLATLVDWPVVLDILANANSVFLVAGTLSLVIGYIIYAIRWRYLMKNIPGLPVVFHIANIGNMVNTLLPLRPGEAIRILLLSRKGSPPAMMAASSIVVERWLETIMRLAALGGAFIFGAGAAVSGLTIIGSVAFLAISFFFMVWLVQRREKALRVIPPWLGRLPRLDEDDARRWLEHLIEGLSGISSLRSLLIALIYSVITWTFFWGFHFLSLLALHPELPVEQLLGISLGSLALVPPSATTLPGIFQVSMVAPLALMGYDTALLTSYSLVLNTLSLIVVVLLGVWGTFASGLNLRQLADQTEAAALEEGAAAD